MSMYDKEKIIPGLIVFFLLMTFPFWYTIGSGKASSMPEPGDSG